MPCAALHLNHIQFFTSQTAVAAVVSNQRPRRQRAASRKRSWLSAAGSGGRWSQRTSAARLAPGGAWSACCRLMAASVVSPRAACRAGDSLGWGLVTAAGSSRWSGRSRRSGPRLWGGELRPRTEAARSGARFRLAFSGPGPGAALLEMRGCPRGAGGGGGERGTAGGLCSLAARVARVALTAVGHRPAPPPRPALYVGTRGSGPAGFGARGRLKLSTPGRGLVSYRTPEQSVAEGLRALNRWWSIKGKTNCHQSLPKK